MGDTVDCETVTPNKIGIWDVDGSLGSLSPDADASSFSLNAFDLDADWSEIDLHQGANWTWQLLITTFVIDGVKQVVRRVP